MRSNARDIVLMIIIPIFAVSCSIPEEPTAPIDPGPAFQTLLDSVVAGDDNIHGAALAVVSPTLGIAWEGAAGMAAPEAGVPMTPANPVRIASNTKTYVATTVLRLAEQGEIDLEAPIDRYLDPELSSLLESDGYDPSVITIRHLLTHTGGLDDHGGAEEYTDAIVADPNHHWTPHEQIRCLVDWCEPLAGPGEVYSYSDSGYVLLGTIIENVTGQSLAEAVRDLVGFNKLGLDSTWWEILEPVPEGVTARAHQYLGDLDVTGFLPYFDLYGGGGIATTMGDLARFHGALFRGEIYSDPETINTMLSTIDDAAVSPKATERSLPPGAYRMGVWVLETEGYTTYHHTGFWGTMAVHVPDLDLTIAATANQNQVGPEFDEILVEVIRIVKRNDEL
jgi:D-alanyl-D-alanine carboxypeptidase